MHLNFAFFFFPFLVSYRWMNRLGLAAIGYTPDDKVPRHDEGETDPPSKLLQTLHICPSIANMRVCFYQTYQDYWSESDQDEVDGSMTLKQEGPSSLCDTYHRTPSVSTHTVPQFSELHRPQLPALIKHPTMRVSGSVSSQDRHRSSICCQNFFISPLGGNK